MSVFLLSFLLLNALEEPQTYSLAFENKSHQLVCPCPPHPQQHTLSTECWCVGIPWSLCGQCGRAAAGQCRCPSKMREGRQRARPIRSEVGSQCGQSGSAVLLLWKLGHRRWDSPVRTGDDNTHSSQVSHAPSDL